MRLSWEYLFGGIFFFAVFFFSPLLKAVGPQQTTIIICTGLVGIAIIKVVENLTEHKQHCQQEDEGDEEEGF